MMPRYSRECFLDLSDAILPVCAGLCTAYYIGNEPINTLYHSPCNLQRRAVFTCGKHVSVYGSLGA